MRFVDFERGQNYSRDGYEKGLVIAYSNHFKHWAYFKDGEYVRVVTEDSNAYKHKNFYRAYFSGKRVPTIVPRKREPQQSIWEGLNDNTQRVIMSTPQDGSSPFYDKYQAEHENIRAKLMDKDVLDAMRYAMRDGMGAIKVDGSGSSQAFNMSDMLKKQGKKMPRFENDTVAKVTETVKQETVDVSLITVGEIIFNMGGSVVERFAPKLTWYEKIFTSKEKRELAVMVGTYVAIQAVKTKYNHYVIDAVSAYLNFEMQKKLLGGLSQETLDKLFSKFEKTSA